MEIKLLKSFVAVAATRSFSAAARELNTVQPAISRHISDLEQELDVSLFWRNTREVKITAAGQSLLRDAQDILDREALAREQAKRAARGKTGRLRIGYLGSACFTFIPWLVREYAKRYPEVQIRLREMSVRQQVEAFAGDTLDVGFSRPMLKGERRGFASVEMYKDPLVAVLPDAHPLATEREIGLPDLGSEFFVLYQRGEAVGLFDKIINICQQVGVAPRISSQPDNMQTVLTEVAAGLGVSILPSCIGNLYTDGCVLLPIRKLNPTIPTELHYRVSHVPPAVEHFVELVEQKKTEIQRMVSNSQ